MLRLRALGQESGQDEDSDEHDQNDVITVPAADTVEWFGNQDDLPLGSEGPEREIEGEVEIDLPLGTAAIDDWGPNDSIRYANEGEEDYDLPSVLIGVEMLLHGEHREDGEVVCSGEVIVKVEGDATDNPLLYVGPRRPSPSPSSCCTWPAADRPSRRSAPRSRT